MKEKTLAMADVVRDAPSRFSHIGFQYRSSAPQTGFQYCAVDSMTTSSTFRSISHSASNRKWLGLLQIGDVQTGIYLRLQRQIRPQPASFYERRFPLFCTACVPSWRE